jgi:Derlin-2/3
VLLKALILSFAYTFSQDNPNSNVSFFFLNFPAKYLPYGLLFLSAVSGGWDSALIEVSGLLAAHLYDFLTRIWPTFGGGRNLVPTPMFVKRWFTPASGSAQPRSFGTAFIPTPEQQPAAAWSGTRGPGRRLGD